MDKLYQYIEQTESTNSEMQKLAKEQKLPDFFTIYTDFQTAGRGQIGNSWESKRGENLLFSTILHPLKVEIYDHFKLTQIASVAIKRVLDRYCSNISIKWPNDIYWKDKKIAGLLIENRLIRSTIDRTIIGVGLNINQKIFDSDAPNPTSLAIITGNEQNREEILHQIIDEMNNIYNLLSSKQLHKEYFQNLFRLNEFFEYKDMESDEIFSAKIDSIKSDGELILLREDGEKKGYHFKEVEFIL